jgi:glycosyltransferase involved in cell wall biosynthesis
MGRIFIDVTQTCRSSNNSGIQVVTRNLFRGLNSRINVIPIVWDNLICQYSSLSTKELSNLENPFSKNYIPKARPNKEENYFLKEVLNSINHFLKKINLKQSLGKKDFILFPEVFRDKRVKFLPQILNKKAYKVAIFHDANVLRNRSSTPQRRLSNFQTYLNIISTFDAISCVSYETKNALYKYGLKEVLPNKVAVHNLPVEAPSKMEPSIQTKTPTILCVSTLSYNKNHINLLKAAEKLWHSGLSFKLELVGQSDPSWTPKVKEYIDQLQKENHPINWAMHIDQVTLEKKYADCQFTVYPSLFEGYGLPIIESLARGKPCICGSNGALGEVSKGGGCELLKNQNDPNQIANAIKLLLTDSTHLKKLKLEIANRDFGTWKKYTSSLLDFLNFED